MVLMLCFSCPEREKRRMTPMLPLMIIMVLLHLRVGLTLYFILKMGITRIKGS